MGAARANPANPVVANGAASFTQAGNLLRITNTPNTIINWGSFSIGANEITRFVQQSSASAVLNRVGAGRDPSSILGSLQSNGRVFLINPNGITFGAGSQINVAGLVASTLNLSDADFLAGRLRFTDGLGSSVINNGNITTGSGGGVYLVGNAVTNNGIITSPKGEVILAAGNSVELVNPGTPDLRVEITAPDNRAVNLGEIVANSGRVGIYAGLIHHAGTINANSVDVDIAGNITLKASRNIELAAASRTTANGPQGGGITIQSGDTTLASGVIEAKGSAGQGGTVNVLGNLVGLIGNATIDVSGETGGGKVRVGGDYHGKNTAIQNAFRTYVGPEALIKADAITSGNGGKVIVWSNDVTRYFGNITARGGAQSGDGGFVEVSGKRALNFSGLVDTSAPKGLFGMLLLDPTDITVVASTAVPGNAADGTWSFAEDPGSQTIGADAIATLLGTGALTLEATNNINVTSAISWTSAQKLTLHANNDLTVSANITNNSTGASAMEFRAGNNVTFDNGVIVTANAGGFSSAAVDVFGRMITLNGQLAAQGGNGGSGAGGDATLNLTSTDRIVAGSGSLLTALGGSGLFTGTAAVNLTAVNGIGATGAPVRIADGSPAVTAHNAAAGGTGDIVLLQSDGDISVDGSKLTVTNGAARGGIDITAETGNINVSAALTNPNGPVTLRSTANVGAGTINISAAGSVRGNGINLIADNLSIAGAVAANTGFGVTIEPFDVNRPITINPIIRGGGAALGLLLSELNLISGDFVTIGPTAASTAGMTITVALDPSVVHTGLLKLRPGTGGLTISNDIDVGAGVLDASGSAVTFNGATPLTVSSTNTNSAGFLAGTISAGTSASSVTLNANTVVGGGPAAPTGSQGVLNLASGKSLTMQGGAVNAGTLNLFGTYVVGSGTAAFGTLNIGAGTGLLKGSGTLNGNVINAGTVAPGSSPGVITIVGNYTQSPSGLLQLELGGTSPGAGHDQLVVTGNVSLGGTLQVLQFGSFIPGIVDKFQAITAGGAITGSFSSVNVPLLFTGLGPTYGSQVVELGGAVGVGGALLDPRIVREDKDIFALVGEDKDIFDKLKGYLVCN